MKRPVKLLHFAGWANVTDYVLMYVSAGLFSRMAACLLAPCPLAGEGGGPRRGGGCGAGSDLPVLPARRGRRGLRGQWRPQAVAQSDARSAPLGWRGGPVGFPGPPGTTGAGAAGAGGGGAPGRGRGVRHCQSHMRVPESQAGIRPGSASAARLRPRPAAAPGPAFDPGDDDRPVLIDEH